MESSVCVCCTSKFARCLHCHSQNLKFNDRWELACASCHGEPNVSNSNNVSFQDELTPCKNCLLHYKCKKPECNDIAKRSCSHCQGIIEYCYLHRDTGRTPATLCDRCFVRYCNRCELRTSDPTFACHICELQQCKDCFDYKDEVQPIAVQQYTCLLCRGNPVSGEPNNPVSGEPKHGPSLWSVDLETCMESYPCQHSCEILYPSGTIVRRILSSTQILDLLDKLPENESLPGPLRNNAYAVRSHMNA